MPALLPMQKCAVVHRLPRAQPRVVRRNAARHLDVKRRCEIQLIHVACANPFMYRRDTPGVFGFGERKLRGDLGFWFRLTRSFFRACSAYSKARQLRRLAVQKCSGVVVECVAPLVDSEPGQRLALAARAHRRLRLKATAALVAEESRRATPLGHRALNLRKQPGNLGRLPRDAHTHGSREQLRPRLITAWFFNVFGVAWFSAFEQHRGWRVFHQLIDLRGKGMPALHADSVGPDLRFSGHRPYCTVSWNVVVLVTAVTPLLDCPATVTVYVPEGVAGGLPGPWL